MTTDLHGHTALVTGGTSGIGRELALRLAAGGAQVVIVGRSAEKAAVITAQSANIRFIQADLSELAQVRQVAEVFGGQHPRLHYLVHSAGIHFYQRRLTGDGVEYNFAANYLNRFALTQHLRPLMSGQPARVIIVGSPYVFDPKRWLTFEGVQGETPLRPLVGLLKAGMANSVWTVELARRVPELDVRNMQPGIVRTDILRYDPLPVRLMDRVMQPLRGMSAEQAGAHYAQLVTADALAGGLFFKNTRRGFLPTTVPAGTYAADLGERLWAFSETLTSETLTSIR